MFVLLFIIKSKTRPCNPNGDPKEIEFVTVKIENDNFYNVYAEKNILDRERLKNEYLGKFINLNAVTQPLKCKVCLVKFHAHLVFGLHSKLHSEDDMYSCHLCDFRSDTTTLFSKHILSHDQYKCKECHQIFKNKRSAYTHSNKHSITIFVKCDICGKDVRNFYLENHRKKVHGKEFVNPSQCTLCEKSFKNSTALHVHYSVKHKEFGIDKSVTCGTCGLMLSSKNILVRHMRTHTADKSVPCTICSRKFISNGMLTAHMRVHTGEKPYDCMYCGRKFVHGTAYRYHIKTHTGEKSCTCPKCGKGFIKKTNMQTHLKICSLQSK